MRCGPVTDYKFPFVFSSLGDPRLNLLTVKNDAADAERAARAEIYRQLLGPFQMDLHEPVESDDPDACSPECPERVYASGIIITDLVVTPIPGAQPQFHWGYRAEGFAHLMVYCTNFDKFEFVPRMPDSAVNPTVCEGPPLTRELTTSASVAFYSRGDRYKAVVEAVRMAQSKAHAIAARIDCPETCPQKMILFYPLGFSDRIYQSGPLGQEMIEVTGRFSLRIDCAHPATSYDLMEKPF